MLERKYVSQCVSSDYCKGWNDAVDSIVRCNECKHCDIGENEVDAWCDCRIFNISGSEDFYCSCGERRNDEQKTDS